MQLSGPIFHKHSNSLALLMPLISCINLWKTEFLFFFKTGVFIQEYQLPVMECLLASCFHVVFLLKFSRHVLVLKPEEGTMTIGG